MPSHLRILDDLAVSWEAVGEIAEELDAPYGIIEDHSHDGRFYLVEWVEDAELEREQIAEMFDGVEPSDIEVEREELSPVSGRGLPTPTCPQDPVEHADAEEVSEE